MAAAKNQAGKHVSTTEPDGSVRIQLRSRADGSTNGLPAGWYLAGYDADGNDGWGDAIWTNNPAEAIVFATATEAHACWTEQSRARPLRPDGQPNRPLTAFTIQLCWRYPHSLAVCQIDLRGKQL